MDFYQRASTILDNVVQKKGSIKTLTLSSNIPDKSRIYAVIHQVLKYKEVIEEIIDRSQLLKAEKKIGKTMALILVHDLLFGKGIQCGGELKQSIYKHKTRLHAELVRVKIKRKAKDNKDLISEKIRTSLEASDKMPRYIRVNLLKISVEDALTHFSKKFPGQAVRVDEHLFDVIVLPPKTDLHDDKYYLDGKIILQDKASCIPAHALDPDSHSSIIDACAAPGNKTTHLSSLVKNTGIIYAFDLDQRRLKTLQKMASKAGCSNVRAIHQSFLDVNPADYNEVKYILLDPSCSGSGIVSRLDQLIDEGKGEDNQLETEKERLGRLSDFQVKMITHALSFPNVQRISYSTCSVHEEENELVVKRILEKHKTWKLVKALPQWKRRGNLALLGESDAASVIRCDPSLDATNGFFVAVFERV